LDIMPSKYESTKNKIVSTVSYYISFLTIINSSTIIDFLLIFFHFVFIFQSQFSIFRKELDLLEFIGLKQELSEMLGVEVDLCNEKCVKTENRKKYS